MFIAKISEIFNFEFTSLSLTKVILRDGSRTAEEEAPLWHPKGQPQAKTNEETDLEQSDYCGQLVDCLSSFDIRR